MRSHDKLAANTYFSGNRVYQDLVPIGHRTDYLGVYGCKVSIWERSPMNMQSQFPLAPQSKRRGDIRRNGKDLKIAYPFFSEHVQKRYIRDSTGRVFGTDSWGYLHAGERWRYTRFSTGDAVGYEPTTPNQADQLDRLINSACFPRNGNPRK
jgi:hypothetical protein